jgi:hypothetical protein
VAVSRAKVENRVKPAKFVSPVNHADRAKPLKAKRRPPASGSVAAAAAVVAPMMKRRSWRVTKASSMMRSRSTKKMMSGTASARRDRHAPLHAVRVVVVTRKNVSPQRVVAPLAMLKKTTARTRSITPNIARFPPGKKRWQLSSALISRPAPRTPAVVVADADAADVAAADADDKGLLKI